MVNIIFEECIVQFVASFLLHKQFYLYMYIHKVMLEYNYCGCVELKCFGNKSYILLLQKSSQDKKHFSPSARMNL